LDQVELDKESALSMRSLDCQSEALHQQHEISGTGIADNLAASSLLSE
jgi:hypothetical protein